MEIIISAFIPEIYQQHLPLSKLYSRYGDYSFQQAFSLYFELTKSLEKNQLD